jgi:hypothetical protein
MCLQKYIPSLEEAFEGVQLGGIWWERVAAAVVRMWLAGAPNVGMEMLLDDLQKWEMQQHMVVQSTVIHVPVCIPFKL